MVWYSHLFQNFPQFIVIHTVKGFSIVNKASLTYAKSFDHISKLNIQNAENENTGLKLNIQKIKIMAFGSIISWQIERENMESWTDFIFLVSKITVGQDSDCNHEMKRSLLLWRKAMPNLAK